MKLTAYRFSKVALVGGVRLVAALFVLSAGSRALAAPPDDTRPPAQGEGGAPLELVDADPPVRGKLVIAEPPEPKGYSEDQAVPGALVLTAMGLRGSVTQVEGREPGAAGGLQFFFTGHVTNEDVSLRASQRFGIALGSAGVEGEAGMDFAGGLRAALGEDHGPFMRLGFRGFAVGNDDFYTSFVEVPQVQLGYQLMRRQLHLELGARGGPVLIGRYNAAGGRRPLGKALEYGGYTAMRFGRVLLEAEWSRTAARSSEPGTDVDMAGGFLCGIHTYAALCFDARVFRGDVRMPPELGGTARLVNTSYLGLTLMAGQIIGE